MEELENLKNEHSRMLYLIGKMYKDGEITQDVKINLKYLVFLNDANLLNVLRKDHPTIEDMKAEIKYMGKNLNHEDLEEELKNSNLFNVNGEQEAAAPQKVEEDDSNQLLMEQSSPVSSFLRNVKKRKQKMDKSVNDFHIEQVNKSDEKDNSVMKVCDFGASPKVQAITRRRK